MFVFRWLTWWPTSRGQETDNRIEYTKKQNYFDVFSYKTCPKIYSGEAYILQKYTSVKNI